MNEKYYKIPLNFQLLANKKSNEMISLNDSISQQIFLLATTYMGECKFDEEYSSDIWKIDFDLLTDENYLKNIFGDSLKKVILKYEKRLKVHELKVNIAYANLATSQNAKVKKCITIDIFGIILKTNIPYHYQDKFYVGPLSY